MLTQVSSEPDSYVSRVRQHMQLKQKVTQCVRDARDAQERAEPCSFRLKTISYR